MIVVTGGAGFIGYNLVKKLIELGYKDIVVVDNNYHKSANMGFVEVKYMNVEDSFLWLEFNRYDIDVIFHLGARTDTMEKNWEIFEYLNYNYSKLIWNFCRDYDIPLIYASSAAVYGDGEFGFSENIEGEGLRFLNPYGWSKLNFDYFVRDVEKTPSFWTGLRFFNVYGNHEQHKGKMASVIWHFYNQIKETGEVKLFKSHVDWCSDGEQKRDFIYVDNVINAMIYIYEHINEVPSGIYNMGTGIARSYNDLARIIFNCLEKPIKISYIDTPMEIRDGYQYFTQANMDKFELNVGKWVATPLERGIELYIKQLEYENR